jgi:hypothetical protein
MAEAAIIAASLLLLHEADEQLAQEKRDLENNSPQKKQTGFAIKQSEFNKGFEVAEKEVSWDEQQKRLKETLGW